MDQPAEPAPLATFLVERYWPASTSRRSGPSSGLDAAAESMRPEGARVEHVGSILMPVDEVVFSLIAARDESLVRELNERAGLPVDRITVAISLSSVPSPTGGLMP